MEIFSLMFITICVYQVVKCDSTADYYENLISKNIADALTYQLSENNADFKSGSESNQINDYGNYDFIIVGAGSAGSVLAARLSEISSWTILLLEAGGEETNFSNIVALNWYLHFSEKNWGYYSTPQTSCCLGMKDRKCTVPRGKSIGGSSAINGVAYVRGNRKDYDRWAELGNSGWSYEEVLPYFKKSENSYIDGDEGYHGTDGVWSVEHSLPPAKITKNFVQANAELNVSYLDYNGRQQIGISRIQLSTKKCKRQSTGTAFLDHARRRKNLKVVTNALATKININSENKTANGVFFVMNNHRFYAKATKEVIVSAGAFNSPQLLILSGIGPKRHLEDLDISVVEDLPVGENLIEHPMFFGLTFRTNTTRSSFDIKEAIHQYLNGFGPLTNTLEAIGFLKVKTFLEDVPTMEYLFGCSTGSNLAIVNRVRNSGEELKNNYFANINSTTDISIQLMLLHPKSRGRVTLTSRDPIDFPNIDLNMLSESEDIEKFIEGIEFVLRLMQTESFKKFNATLLDIPLCTNFEKLSRQFWECAVRHMSFPYFHASGTTAMGPNRSYAVVDADLNVYGIKKLRVVDAGVFPTTVSGHTNAPTVMIAEKISDVIINYYL